MALALLLAEPGVGVHVRGRLRGSSEAGPRLDVLAVVGLRERRIKYLKTLFIQGMSEN